MNYNIKYRRASQDTDDNVTQIPDPGVTPKPLVKLQRHKHQSADQYEPGHHLDHQSQMVIGNHSIKSDPERQVIGEHDQHDMKSDDERSTKLNNNGFHHNGASRLDLE